MNTPKDTAHQSKPSLSDAEYIGLVFQELRNSESRVAEFNGRSVHIVQFLILTVGAGTVAAASYPLAFTVVPVFWTSWLLYALQVDRETIRHESYCKFLEKQANTYLASAGRPIIPRYWTQLKDVERPHIDSFLYLVPPTYLIAIQLILTGIGTIPIWQELPEYRVPSLLIYSTLLAFGFVTVAISAQKQGAARNLIESSFEVVDEVQGT